MHFISLKHDSCRHLGRERLENRRAFVRPPVVAMLSRARGPLEAPLDNGVVRAELRVLSLAGKEGRSTFGGVAGILTKF